MKKITINHYINKSLKPKKDGNIELYPLYVQIIVNSTNHRIKSTYPLNEGYLNKAVLNSALLTPFIEYEKREIEKVVRYYVENNTIVNITAKTIQSNIENLYTAIDRKFSQLFEDEAIKERGFFPEILINSSFEQLNELLIFTESEIDIRFSGFYRNCKEAIKAVLFAFTQPRNEIDRLTVFDLIHGNAEPEIIEAIKQYHPFLSNNAEDEYREIIKDLKRLLST